MSDNIKPRSIVEAFATHMEIKLRANDHKGGWGACSMGYLRRRLADESGELRRQLDREPCVHDDIDEWKKWSDRVTKEAADVANFAMMIADNTARRVEKKQGVYRDR